ncbi:MAG: sigma-54-dependent Fis family transcriptional regulator, partial [Deltaproteobacteria bacterium]|nr:sigma-54-dependent Fis family transcriptional regulator [Deltaproteobacteria bacterium]
FVLAESGLIAAEQLPPLFGRPNKVSERNHVFDNTEHLDQKEALVQALRQCGGNQSQAARLLNINRVTVWNRIKKYGIDLKKI